MKFKSKVADKYLLLRVDEDSFKRAIQLVGFDVKRSSIVAMSYTRKKAMADLEALHAEIAGHLLRLVAMPTSRSAVHWKDELQTWKERLRLRNNAKNRSGKNYSEKVLLKWLWEYPLSTDADRCEWLKQLKEKGYAVPKALNSTCTARLKKSVENFVADVLKTSKVFENSSDKPLLAV